MKNTLVVLALTASFGSGFALNSVLNKTTQQQAKRVTGIGGIFFKCKDPQKIREWYKTHLGFDMSAYGSKFEWRENADSTKKGSTLWTPFSEKTKYFDPSTKDFMINYRVENLDALVNELKREDVKVLDKIEPSDYGKFVHILDPEGNKIELWEPKE